MSQIGASSSGRTQDFGSWRGGSTPPAPVGQGNDAGWRMMIKGKEGTLALIPRDLLEVA